ncbi:hypothetical protein ADUPG1_000492, partial [Aduncisulcus paluster]
MWSSASLTSSISEPQIGGGWCQDEIFGISGDNQNISENFPCLSTFSSWFIAPIDENINDPRSSTSLTQNSDNISTFKDVLSYDYFSYSSTPVSDTSIEVSINNTPFACHTSGFTTNLSVDKALFPHQYSTHDEGIYHQHSLLPQPLRGLLLLSFLLFLVAALSITLVVIGLVVRMRSSIPTILIFLVVLSLSFQSVLCDGYLSNECSMYISEDDHLECNEVYPGRYAAECEDGYYYDQGEYSCVEDTNTDCPSDMNDNQMCVKTADGDVITSDCRSAWYGDDCNQLYSVHIPDTLFRGKVCDAISNSDPLCDVSEFEMAAISGIFYSYSSHITTFEGAQSEDDNDYWTFITTVFPIHESTNKDKFYIPNSCALNNVDDYVCDSETYPTQCPSIVLNEVYNSVDGVNEKQCAFIAKEGSSGECYTVHDDSIRQYLKDHCLSTSNVESNGVITVATMRNDLTCTSLSLPSIATDRGISLNSITTLQGLEYATSLTSLTLDGYDLSGDINSNAEYDKLVVQILAKAVTYTNDYGSIDSGLRILSASGCGLSAISDVLDLTPIASGDSKTDQFKLTSLDLSNNSISDVSVLVTESIFPDDTDVVLTTLDISGNSICDIDGMVDELETYFASSSISITSSDQTCHCSASVSSAAHQVCREVYPDRWAVECWNGYYLDKASGECLEVCASGSELDSPNGTPPYSCITAASDVDDSIRVQVCERNPNMMAVLEVSASSITCGCTYGLHGEDCSSECPIVGGEVCSGHGSCNTTDHVCECDTWYDGASCSTLVPIYSAECDRTFNIDDHLECNEVYPGRYAAECEDGYYYDQGEYSCVEDTNTDCPSDMNDNQMCVKTADGDVITSDCRSAWYGDDCNQLYSVHIPDTLFRGKVCDAISNSDPLCDVSEFEMSAISGIFYSYELHVTSFKGAESENDTDYWTFITTVFPIHSSNNKDNVFIPNSCSLNNVDDYVCDSETYPTQCPSIVLNEVYNNVDGVNEKQCAFIAKEGSSGECYTVHDDSIRQYLNDHCLSSSNVESNGVISVATMRSVLSCPLDTNSNESLSLPDIASAASLSSVNSITTLQGLEYATSLTSLSLDGYDLSGDINSNAEYDKLVVQILAKAVTYGSIDSGLRILSASGCGLSAISDVLDLTPIASGDSTTDKFKLISLDLSNNSISDVSVLITSSIFPNNFLATLDISDNSICDIDNIVTMLQTHFTNTNFTINATNQSTCPCSEGVDVSFSSHKTCRQRSDGDYQVECWNGYYLDKETNSCVEAVTSEDSIRCQVCERKDFVVPILDIGASDVLCGCSFGFHGDSCEYVDIPDSNLRSALCLAVTNPSAHDSSCDDLTIADMATVTSVSASTVDSFEGLQHAVNLTSLSISGTSSSSVSIGNTDLAYLPLSLTDLTLEAVYLDADSDFTSFTNLTTLSLKNNSSYDLTNSALFPSTSTFTSLDVSYTALSSFSSIPTSITTLTVNNCFSLTSFSTISNLTNLVSLDVSYASNVSDFSSLLSNIPLTISILYADGCNVAANTNFSTFSNLSVLSLKNNSLFDLTNADLLPTSSLFKIDVSYTALSTFSFIPASINEIFADGCDVSASTDFTSFTALTTLSLNDNPSFDITEFGLFPSPSSLTSFSANNTSISLLFHLVASMPNLTELSLNNNNISDPSPLYALSSNDNSWSSIDLSYNHICGGDNGDSEVQTFLASKFSLSTADVNASGQACECSSDDLGSTPITDNKVCSETKPGSGSWYVVCASDSFTSYTSAEDFTCTQPDSSSATNCSGGCEYGYECRNDPDLESISCQQVTVDDYLHACVASMFVDEDGNPDYRHRTDSTPSLFSVASLKTLESALDTGTDEYSPILSCSNSTSPISVLSGLEHLVGISEFQLSNDGLTDTSELSSLSTLTLLKRLDLSSNSSLSSLPDLSDVSLAILNINATSIVLPDTSASTQLIPDSLVELHMYDTPTVQAGFDTQVGSSHLSGLKMIDLGN